MMSVFQKLNKKYPLLLYLVALGFLKISVYSLNGEESLEDQGAELYEVATKAANQNDERSLLGHDPKWLFLRNELNHVGKGEFWNKNWAEVSASGKDPLEIFLAFKTKLDSLGVEFIYVPIPAKVTIYPDRFSNAIAIKNGLPAINDLYQMKPYLDKFRESGINVIDIEPLLKERRKTESFSSYCKTDSHPSPWTCQMIASILSEKINSLDWSKKYKKNSDVSFVKGDAETIQVFGDLISNEGRESWTPEKLSLTKVYSIKDGKKSQVIPDDDSSPVIVMGDSHTLIYHEGDDMHASGAGIVDHLQEKIGFKIFLAASRGSSSQALRQIYKGKEFWEEKKMLIWISSIREFTEERRWLQLPRIPR